MTLMIFASRKKTKVRPLNISVTTRYSFIISWCI